MQRDHTDGKRQFVQVSKAWYSVTSLGYKDEDIITIGIHHHDGGTSGEFQVVWRKIGFNESTPQLQVFDDGWSALSHFSDLLEKMAEIDSEDIRPDKFCELLESLGIENVTPTEHK